MGLQFSGTSGIEQFILGIKILMEVELLKSCKSQVHGQVSLTGGNCHRTGTFPCNAFNINDPFCGFKNQIKLDLSRRQPAFFFELCDKAVKAFNIFRRLALGDHYAGQTGNNNGIEILFLKLTVDADLYFRAPLIDDWNHIFNHFSGRSFVCRRNGVFQIEDNAIGSPGPCFDDKFFSVNRYIEFGSASDHPFVNLCIMHINLSYIII